MLTRPVKSFFHNFGLKWKWKNGSKLSSSYHHRPVTSSNLQNRGVRRTKKHSPSIGGPELPSPWTLRRSSGLAPRCRRNVRSITGLSCWAQFRPSLTPRSGTKRTLYRRPDLVGSTNRLQNATHDLTRNTMVAFAFWTTPFEQVKKCLATILARSQPCCIESCVAGIGSSNFRYGLLGAKALSIKAAPSSSSFVRVR